ASSPKRMRGHRISPSSASPDKAHADRNHGSISSIFVCASVPCARGRGLAATASRLLTYPLMAKKGTILIVDDEEVMRDVLGSLLEDEGYQIELAKNGEEGIDKFQQRPFDLVLLDVSMPGMGGLRTLEELLKLDPEAVITMITAYAT